MADKVVHIGSGHPARHIRIHQKECRSLADAGYDVRFIAVHDKFEIIDGVKIIPVRPPQSRFDRLCIWPWKVYKAAISQKADIYHLHNPSLLPVGRLLALSGATVIFDMHENTPKWLLTAPWLPHSLRGAASRIYSAVERILIGGFPVIFAESSYAKDYPWVKKHETVLNMPDTNSLLKLTAQKYDVPKVVYFGVVQPDRGSMITLEVLKILRERGQIVHWLCIGPASDAHRSEILETATKYGVADQVELHGWVSPEEGWLMVTRCHIGLALLEPLPNYTESYPTKIFEYMALGLPVITSNFPLYKSVVEEYGCGVCVDPTNSQQIAKTIESILTDVESARQMGICGRRAACERFSWPSEAAKLLLFYKSILADR